MFGAPSGNGNGDDGRSSRWRRVIDFLWAVDAAISTAVFETGDFIRRRWLAYGEWLQRFRVRGLKRLVVELVDDAATFVTIFAFVILAYVMPPLPHDEDIFNARRQIAVTITDEHGEVIGWRGIRQDDSIPLSEYSPYLIKAVLATEDARFYEHFGVDVIGTLRAAIANARAHGVVQGGSTLTQQLAKNLFLSPERSFRRKIHEAFLALWIEAHLSKDEILKMYLDRSYLGAGNYGVEAASQFYFGKSARDLNLKEAAIIAGLFKAPSKYAPHTHPEAAERRATVVLHRMLDAGFISFGELLAARDKKVRIIGNQEADKAPQHFLDLVYRETLDLMKRHHISGEYTVEVKSTIDMRLQKLAEKAVREALETYGKRYHATQGALVSLTPDGAIRAIVGGRDYESSQFNRATDAWRQPGSSFKPFVYLTALLKGMTPRTVVMDGPITINGWTPHNYSGRYHGRVTLLQAITHSYNSVPVHLMVKVGRKSIIETARKAGLDAPLKPVPSLPLGSNEVTVLDITGAYAAFANGGYRVQPYSVLEIRRPDGTLLYSRTDDPEAKPVRVFPREKIAELVSMMANVVQNGTARRARLGFTAQAGKTGTTSSYRDAWFIGFTAHLVTGVWFGNDDYSVTNRMTGGSLPAMTWKNFMMPALADAEPKPLPGVPLTRAQLQVAAERHRKRALASRLALAADKSQTPSTPGSLALAMLPDISEIGPRDVLLATAPMQQADAEHAQRRGDADLIARALRDMFSIFRTDRRRTILRADLGRRPDGGLTRPRPRANFRSGRRGAPPRRKPRKRRIKFLNIFR